MASELEDAGLLLELCLRGVRSAKLATRLARCHAVNVGGAAVAVRSTLYAVRAGERALCAGGPLQPRGVHSAAATAIKLQCWKVNNNVADLVYNIVLVQMTARQRTASQLASKRHTC